MDSIEQLKYNYDTIKKDVIDVAISCNRNPNDIKILAVSKTHDISTLLDAAGAGVNIFAENYAQELRDKFKELFNLTGKNDIINAKFHFIGHLQSNKVKYIVPHITTIHTVDSIDLANEIEKQATKHDKHIDILIQVNTSNQESKSGIEPQKVNDLAKNLTNFEHINLVGLMTIGTFSDDEKLIRSEFSLLRNSLSNLNKELGLNLSQLSMGMSHDYKIAIEEQATMLRIGTAIFGNRFYE